jgi:hypothetical protein
MTEIQHNPEESGEEKIFTLGHFSEDGLPEDLGNDTSSVDLALSLYKRGTYGEKELREAIKRVRSFEEYFRGQVKEHNNFRQQEGLPLYDEEESLVVAKEIIGLSLISKFDEKILELRKLADNEELDKEAIEKIIKEDIRTLIAGK